MFLSIKVNFKYLCGSRKPSSPVDCLFGIHIYFPGLQNAPFMPLWARAYDFNGVSGDWIARFFAMLRQCRFFSFTFSNSFFVFTLPCCKLPFCFTYITFFTTIARNFIHSFFYFFYKNLFYKNMRLKIAKKLRTS